MSPSAALLSSCFRTHHAPSVTTCTPPFSCIRTFEPTVHKEMYFWTKSCQLLLTFWKDLKSQTPHRESTQVHAVSERGNNGQWCYRGHGSRRPRSSSALSTMPCVIIAPLAPSWRNLFFIATKITTNPKLNGDSVSPFLFFSFHLS